MSSAVEKRWFAIGFWHSKTDVYSPPSGEVVEYIKETTNKDILKEYENGYKAGKKEYYGY